MGSERIARFSVSLPERLLSQYDELVRAKGYKTRSHAVADMIRAQLAKFGIVLPKGIQHALKLVDRLLYVAPDGSVHAKESDIPFYKHQNRIVFGNSHFIDPENVDDYLALDGYKALATCLGTLSPEEVLEIVKKANLRGRGGGG